jgi:glutamine synthetase adenylyltransferase
MSATRRLVAVSDRLYRLLLTGYPASFRRHYGPHMAQVFRDSARDAWHRRGLLGLMALWTHTLSDLVATVPQEHLAELRATSAAPYGAERSIVMALNTLGEYHPFAERLAEVLDREPSYYQLLISTEPTRRMSDLIASLALDADPDQPETTLALFQELGTDVPEEHMHRWLARLRGVARRIYVSTPRTEAISITEKLLQRIYADPHLYELVAATEPGYGLLDIIESLALEVNLDEVEDMIKLMHQLCGAPQASVTLI